MGNDWKDTLRQKMSGYTEQEPEGLLQDIMKELDTIPALHGQSGKEQPSRKAAVIRFAATCAAAAASIALIATIWNNTPDSREGNAIAVLNNKPDEQIQTDILPDLLADNSEPGISVTNLLNNGRLNVTGMEKTAKNAGRMERTATAEKNIPVSSGTDNSKDDNKPGSTSDIICENTSGNTTGSVRETGPERKPEDSCKDYFPDDNWDNDFPEEKIKRKKRNFSTDIFYTNLSGSNNTIAGFSTMRQLGTTPFSGIPARESVSAKPGEGIMLITSGENSNTSVKHRQPVRVGASVRYNFTKCWGIETGLVYSYLSSRMETSESGYNSVTEQKLHYIGIPVKVNWSFLNRKHVSLYLNAGGMVEKCVGGNATTDYMLDGNRISSTKDNISIKPLQWSASAAAGVQWNISRHIGIYAEPGISYHFNDGSHISTAYKEKPLNFNIELGLRFSFK